MKLSTWNFLSLISLLVGETFSIYAELIAAKDLSISSDSALAIFFRAFVTATLAGVFLILGYMLGFKSFANIWIITAFSTSSILIVEPLLAYTIFNQLPTKGAVIGLILGGIGIIATLIE